MPVMTWMEEQWTAAQCVSSFRWLVEDRGEAMHVVVDLDRLEDVVHELRREEDPEAVQEIANVLTDHVLEACPDPSRDLQHVTVAVEVFHVLQVQNGR